MAPLQKQKCSSAATAPAPIAGKKQPRKPAIGDDDELDDTFNLQQLQKRLSEMRKAKADTASYVDKFSENARRQQDEALAELRAQQNEFNLVNEKADSAIATIRDEIARSSNTQKHPLRHAQLNIYGTAERLVDLNKPLLEIIDTTLKDAFHLGDDWEETAEDAVKILNILKEEVEKNVAAQISPDTKVDRENPGWGQAVKMTNRSMHRALRHLPVVVEAEGN